MNLCILGNKLRKQISKAIVRRSTTLRNTLQTYNELAPLQVPPRPVLQYSDIINYASLGEFEFLKHSRHLTLAKPWSRPANREVAAKFFKIVRAKEEILRLNVEIGHLATWLDDEDNIHALTVTSLSTANPPLASELCRISHARRQVNDQHRAKLSQIYNLSGYTGTPLVSTSKPLVNQLDSTTRMNDDEDDLMEKAGQIEAFLELVS
jgi:hypothetical protein